MNSENDYGRDIKTAIRKSPAISDAEQLERRKAELRQQYKETQSTPAREDPIAAFGQKIPAASPVDAETEPPPIELGSWQRSTKGFGIKYLARLGYTGGGLGKKASGITEPVAAVEKVAFNAAEVAPMSGFRNTSQHRSPIVFGLQAVKEADVCNFFRLTGTGLGVEAGVVHICHHLLLSLGRRSLHLRSARLISFFSQEERCKAQSA